MLNKKNIYFYVYLFLMILTLIIYYFSYYNLSLVLFIIGTFFGAFGFYKLKYKKYILFFFGIILTISLSVLYLDINYKFILVDLNQLAFYLLNFLIFLIIPYTFLEIENYVKTRYPSIINILIPNDEKEIKREDSIIIDLIGFFQAIIFLKFLKDEILFLQVFTLIGFITFIIPRSIAIIKDNNKLRKISLDILIFIIISDIYMMIYTFINLDILMFFPDRFNLSGFIIYMLLFLYTFVFSFLFLNDLIEKRYNAHKD